MNIRLTEELAWELFEYATSIGEDTADFVNKEITGKEYLSITYYQPTKQWLKTSFKQRGVKGTRKYLATVLKRFGILRY